MIHINYPSGRRPPDEWLEKAKALTERLKRAPSKNACDNIIEENAHVWGEIKDWLDNFSNGKCWFSEARGACFHWQVEHFRPKKEARDPDRDGYWWRAFDYLNYRLCGSVTNSKKGSYFPLRPGTAAAASPEDDCDDEAIILIDPVRKSDVDLITFSDGGVAAPAVVSGWERERADISIKRYKLNEHIPLLRARQAIWNLCRENLAELEVLIAERQQAELAGKYSGAREQKIEARSRDLEAMATRTAEFSGVARAFLLQDPRIWVRRLVA
jgi:hypothetical protein